MKARDKLEQNKKEIDKLREQHVPITIREMELDKEQSKLIVQIVKEEKLLENREWKYIKGCGYSSYYIDSPAGMTDDLEFISPWDHSTLELVKGGRLVVSDNSLYISVDSTDVIPKLIEEYNIKIDFSEIIDKIKELEEELEVVKGIRKSFN